MRIGLLDTWLSKRYLPFWRPYLQELGVQLLSPRLPVSEALLRIEEPWPRSARLLAARALELKAQGAEALLLPAALADSPRGSGQCPWIVDPASMLEREIGGLPRILRVSPELGGGALGEAARLGQELLQNPQQVRLAIERSRRFLTPYKPPAMPRGERILGVVAQPHLLEDERLYPEVLEAAERYGWKVALPDASPERLREEGARVPLNVDLPNDLEFVGAGHYLGRLGRVGGVLLLVDDHCQAVERLARKLSAQLHKANAVYVLGGDAAGAVQRIMAAG